MVAALWSASAGAQVVKDASRAAARDLGYSGIERYQAGSFEEAFTKLDKAYQVLHAPSLGLWSARALIKLNRWVEAAERLRQVLSLEPKGGEAAVQQQALRECRQELDSLTPRIPSLIIEAKGAGPNVLVTVDGDVVAQALLGEAFPANPGQHVVVGRSGGRDVKREVSLREGKRERVALKFEEPSATAAVPVSGAPVGATSMASANQSSNSKSVRKTAGWVLVGTGAAGVAFGATTGLLALSKQGSLKDSGECQGQQCLRPRTDDVNAFNSLRMLSSIGLIAGAGVAAVGVVLIVTAPPAESKTSDSVARLWLSASPGEVSVAGRF